MMKLLIVEDDQQLQQMFIRILNKHGYSAVGVSNGQLALDALDKDYFDLIITDIMMPEMDGFELVQQLRDVGNMIPILMITAKDAFDDMSLGFRYGVDDYMVKPININEMVLRVKALLRRAQMINDHKQTLGGTVLEHDSFTLTANGETMVLPKRNFCSFSSSSPTPTKYSRAVSSWTKSGIWTARVTSERLTYISAACATDTEATPILTSSPCADSDIRRYT